MSMFDLSEKKALVTGGSRGIGRGIAEGLLEAGASVTIIGTSDSIFSAAGELEQATQGVVHPIQADLSDRKQLQRAFEQALEQLGTLDVLVVNHGIQRRHAAEDFLVEDWDLVLETNLTSMFLLNQMAGRLMLAKGQGKIINIASLLSFSGGITVPAYASAKGGVAQLTKAFSNEWANRGVNVNAIAPGYIETDAVAALAADPVRNRQILVRIPAGRWGKPEDLKGAAVFLASEASDYVHGTVLLVDGGWMGR